VPTRRPLDPLRIAVRETDVISWSAAVVAAGDSPAVLDELDGDAVLPTASIGKIMLLAAVVDGGAHGRLDPGELLAVADEDRVQDSGLLQHLDHQVAPIADLCRFVGAVSDNLATNVLIRRVGLARVREAATALGLAHCALHDIVRDVREAAHPPFLSTGCASELAELMRRIAVGTAISTTVSHSLADLLRLNTDLSMVAAAFGLDPLAHVDGDLGVRLFNKTGTQVGTRADVGVVSWPAGERSALAYAVIARFEDSAEVRRGVLDAMRAVGDELRGG
jgi:beta-lactamase class A